MTQPVYESIPTPAELHERLGRLLRELAVTRRFLKLAELAEQHKQLDQRPTASRREAARV